MALNMARFTILDRIHKIFRILRITPMIHEYP